MFRQNSHRNLTNALMASVAVAGLLLGVETAQATGTTQVTTNGLGMRVQNRTSPPAGHVYYCANEPRACDRYGQGAVILTQKSWKQLVTVNSTINKSIAPKEDGRIDKWSVYVSKGDCEDYALTKQRELLRRGWPSDALLITTAYLPDGTYHAVLVVRTDRGEFVLDNLNPLILPWQKVAYRWNKRQAVGNPQVWQTIAGAPRSKQGQSVARLRPAFDN